MWLRAEAKPVLCRSSLAWCQGRICGFTRHRTYKFVVPPGALHPHPGREPGAFPTDHCSQRETAITESPPLSWCPELSYFLTGMQVCRPLDAITTTFFIFRKNMKPRGQVHVSQGHPASQWSAVLISELGWCAPITPDPTSPSMS